MGIEGRSTEPSFFDGGHLLEPIDNEAFTTFLNEVALKFKGETVITDDIITLSGNGVTSVFFIDRKTGKIELLQDRSFDLFGSDDDDVNGHWSDPQPRPIKSGDDIHSERLTLLGEILAQSKNQDLIEDTSL